MIPYPYNMVDMGGIDLAEANGTIVEGLYAKIVEAVNACGDIVLYNWKFASIEIAPQHTSILLGSPLVINGVIQVTELDQISIIGQAPPTPPTPPSILIPITITKNGQYSPLDYDAEGFSAVTVNVHPHYVKIPLIPQMTSDTLPSGVASASSSLSSLFAAYRAFDRSEAVQSMQGGWLASASDQNPYLMYEFDSAKELWSIEIHTANNSSTTFRTVTIEGRINGNWENCIYDGNSYNLEFRFNTYGSNCLVYNIELNGNTYEAIRISGNQPFYGGANSYACTFSEVQVYTYTED